MMMNTGPFVAGESLMLLTPAEWVALQVCQRTFRWRTLWLLAIIGSLWAMHWVYDRVMAAAAAANAYIGRSGGQPPPPPPTAEEVVAPAPPPPTLWNPGRLEEMIQFFIKPAATNGQAGTGDRHRTEALCRGLLEYMLEMPLPKVRPAWLMNPTTKRRLELDMYNEEHRLAFEYDGAQHDVYTPHYHANEHHFEYRRLLDRLKTEMCRERGVMLIRIPWSEVSVRDATLTARYLEQLLVVHGIPFRSAPVDVASKAMDTSTDGGARRFESTSSSSPPKQQHQRHRHQAMGTITKMTERHGKHQKKRRNE